MRASLEKQSHIKHIIARQFKGNAFNFNQFVTFTKWKIIVMEIKSKLEHVIIILHGENIL